MALTSESTCASDWGLAIYHKTDCPLWPWKWGTCHFVTSTSSNVDSAHSLHEILGKFDASHNKLKSSSNEIDAPYSISSSVFSAKASFGICPNNLLLPMLSSWRYFISLNCENGYESSNWLPLKSLLNRQKTLKLSRENPAKFGQYNIIFNVWLKPSR